MKEVQNPNLLLFFLSGRWSEWWRSFWGPRFYEAESLWDLEVEGPDLPYTNNQRRFGSEKPVAVVILKNIRITAIPKETDGYDFFLSEAGEEKQRGIMASWPRKERHGWLYHPGKMCASVVVLLLIEENRVIIDYAGDSTRERNMGPPPGDNNPGFI